MITWCAIQVQPKWIYFQGLISSGLPAMKKEEQKFDIQIKPVISNVLDKVRKIKDVPIVLNISIKN